jgi:hypothetical protein
MENNSSKTEESPLKNHPLYENRGDDLVFRLQKEIEQLKIELSKFDRDIVSKIE